MTVAPIWATPAAFFTCPRIPPDSGAGSAPWAQGDRHMVPIRKPSVIVDVRRLMLRRLCHPYVTVNVADGVNVWLRFLSTTFIFNVYWPGSRSFNGRSFSTVTCAAPPERALTSSLNSNTFWLDPFLVISYSMVPSGFLVFSSGSKL